MDELRNENITEIDVIRVQNVLLEEKLQSIIELFPQISEKNYTTTEKADLLYKLVKSTFGKNHKNNDKITRNISKADCNRGSRIMFVTVESDNKKIDDFHFVSKINEWIRKHFKEAEWTFKKIKEEQYNGCYASMLLHCDPEINKGKKITSLRNLTKDCVNNDDRIKILYAKDTKSDYYNIFSMQIKGYNEDTSINTEWRKKLGIKDFYKIE